MSTPAPQVGAVHCPHCLQRLGGEEQRTLVTSAMRCSQCRLVIGSGRAVLAQDVAESNGMAAGLAASAARREDCEPGDGRAIEAALRAVATELGCDVRRLRMLDYQHECDRDDALPTLGVVLATHGSWKDARRLAAGTDLR